MTTTNDVPLAADGLDPDGVERAAQQMRVWLLGLGSLALAQVDDLAPKMARAALAAARDGEAAGREAVDDVLNRWSTGPALAQMVVAEVRGALLADAPTVTAEQRARLVALTYASADGTEYEHDHGVQDGGSPECPACWAGAIRGALGIEVREP